MILIFLVIGICSDIYDKIYKKLMFNIFIYDFLNLSMVVFAIGLWGLVISRINFILVLLSLELLIFASNLNLIIFSIFFDDLAGQIFALCVLAVAACESAIGLAILVVYYRLRGIISINAVSVLKG